MRSLMVPGNTLLRATLPSIASPRVTLPTPRRRSFTRTFAATSTTGYGDIDQTGESSHPGLASSRPGAAGGHPGCEPMMQGKGEEKNSRASNKGRSEAAAGSEGRKEGGSRRKSKFDMSMPELNERDREEVERHNREMDKRYDRRQGVDETVGRGFWSGQGGRDRDP